MRAELRNVTKRFGAVAALRDVSIDLPAGSRTALIGPNGAGKSTLTRILMGMLACTGEVLLDGRSPYRDRAELAHRLAYVPQVAPLLGATVGELVRTVAQLRRIPVERFADSARGFGIELSQVRGRPLRGLSGGMRQKLLLALALSTDASLFLLDEPTASLDVASRRRFFERVADLPEAPTIVLSSHRLEEIRHLVDRVLVLDAGSVTFDGDAAEYLRTAGTGILEVKSDSRRAIAWLADRGFTSGTAGWWSFHIRNGHRIELVTELLAELGDDLADLVVRDVEHLPNLQERLP